MHYSVPSMQTPYRLAIIAPHVIQYHSPLYRAIAASGTIRPTVLFLDRAGAEPAFSRIIGRTICWDVPLLEGFEHAFVKNWSPARQRALVARVNPGLARHLSRRRFDGVLIQGYDTLSTWLAFALAKACGLDVLLRGETVLKPEGDRGLAGWFKQRLVTTLLRHSDAVLYSCSGIRRAWRHYGCGEGRLFAIPCAVDNDFFRRQRDALAGQRTARRGELGIGPDECVLLYSGRLSGVKRQHDLLRAAARLRERASEPVVLLMGEGPARSEIETLRDELGLKRVIMTGFVNQSQVSRYYSIADIQVLCSSHDPSPKAINEGLNFGLPLISSDRPGTIGDTIVHGDNARVYPCGDVGALAGAIALLTGDPALRRRMGGRSLALSDQWSLAAGVAGLEQAVAFLRAVRPGSRRRDPLLEKARAKQFEPVVTQEAIE